MKMIVRRSKTTGNVKSIMEYEPATYRDLEKIYNNNLSTSTVDVVDIPENALESYKYGSGWIVKAEYIRDVLEKAE